MEADSITITLSPNDLKLISQFQELEKSDQTKQNDLNMNNLAWQIAHRLPRLIEVSKCKASIAALGALEPVIRGLEHKKTQ